MKWAAIVGVSLVVLFGLGVAGSFLVRRHHTSDAPASAANSPEGGQVATTTILPASEQLYDKCSGDTNSISFTDSGGNKADGSFCGYTVTGEDVQGNSAPAGYSFDNVLIYLSDDQTDRAASLINITADLYMEFGVRSCAAPENTPVPADCVSFLSGPPNYEGLWSYSETGGTAPADYPVAIQPGPGQLFFISVEVPSSDATPTGVYSASDTGAGFSSTIGPQLSVQLFSTP